MAAIVRRAGGAVTGAVPAAAGWRSPVHRQADEAAAWRPFVDDV